jgi:hypothetical protein
VITLVPVEVEVACAERSGLFAVVGDAVVGEPLGRRFALERGFVFERRRVRSVRVPEVDVEVPVLLRGVVVEPPFGVRRDDVGGFAPVAAGVAPLVEPVEDVPGGVTSRERTDERRPVARLRERRRPGPVLVASVEDATASAGAGIGVAAAVVDDAGMRPEARGEHRRPRGKTRRVRGVVVREPTAVVGETVDRG